jgi:cell division protein FtsQ
MKTEVEIPNERSWREIRQSVNTRTMTTHGRRRLGWNLVNATFSLLMLGALAALGVYLFQGFDRPAQTLGPVVRQEPLREIVLINEGGVLSESWVADRLGLPEGIALMAVDLERAKTLLEREGQVRTAVVTRDFPGTLVVTIEERVPVLRVLVPGEGGARLPMFVARDGVVYRGFDYDPAMVVQLPWMDGVRLVRDGEGFVPVAGIDRVSELLLHAREHAPHLASAFKVVSLSELPRIVVRTEFVKEIIFEGPDLKRQLARLDYIIEHFGKLPQPPASIERIDLSVSSQVAVRLGSSPAPTSRPRGRPGSTLFTNNTSNNQSNRGHQR